MKLNANTLAVLRNFSGINPSIVVKPGKVLSTIAPSKTIYARATVESEFDRRFAIYDLSRFISAITLFEEPELTFGESSVRIHDSTSKSIQYKYASEDVIKYTPPDKDIKLPSVDVSFALSDKTFREITKAASVLGLTTISVVGNGTTVTLQAEEIKSGSSESDSFSVNVGETDKTFKAVFKSENLMKLISGDYRVDISSKGISHFVGQNIEYFVAVEANSKF
jgi:hypothetical protein